MDVFDATKVTPSQGVGGHPPGRFPFTITNTYAKENNSKTGAMLVVELTSDVGRIENRYNIWNQSAQAVDIAQKELSALCHAIGIFKITFPRDPQGNYDMANAARELRGGRGKMEVAPQVGKDGQPNGYMEVKKVFDINGNEPGKQGSAPQPQQPQWQPGGWSAGPNQQPQPQANPNPPSQQNQQQGWGGAPQQQQQPPQQGGWAPQGNGQSQQFPPWGK